jgi:hypothetical protein
MASVVLLAAMIRQQCNAQGGVLYKPHWYSKARCETPAQIESERQAELRKKEANHPSP